MDIDKMKQRIKELEHKEKKKKEEEKLKQKLKELEKRNAKGFNKWMNKLESAFDKTGK